MHGTHRFAGWFIDEDGDCVGKCIAILLADGDLFSRQLDMFVVEGDDLFDGNDIAAMDATEEIAGQQLFPLFEGDQHQGRRPVFENETGVILPGLDEEDMPEIHFHESSFMTDKEK